MSTGAGLEDSLRELARRTGRRLDTLRQEAQSCHAEFHAERSRFGVRAFAAMSRLLARRGYDSEIVCDAAEFSRIAELAADGPVVYLVTHKTYLDIFVLYHALYERGIDTPYVFGGINMDFFGLGALSRRAGGIFIRREFRDDAVYKLALRDYVSGLLEQGSSFMWAIEGTRSRTGKLVMPKLGLLKYVVGASRGLDPGAVKYLPVSIAYDQIPDVADMTAQQIGATKRPESFSWFLRYIRGLKQPLGRIYIRFGEPVSLHDTPDAPGFHHRAGDEETLAIQKLAFEICFRINQVTPPTTVSLVLMALLCEESVDRERLADDIDALCDYIRRHNPLATKTFTVRPSAELDVTLSALRATGLVQVSGDGRVMIPQERHLAALYYSNMVAHHFVIAAFLELALLSAAETGAGDEFWSVIDGLRDLFKMEFFFARRDEYRRQVENELSEHDPGWQGEPATGDAARRILTDRRLFVAKAVLLPIVEAYGIVARGLRQGLGDPDPGDNALVEAFLGLGRRMADEGEIRWPHSASRALLAGGVLLARNRGLLCAATPDLERRRRDFEDEICDIGGQLTRFGR